MLMGDAAPMVQVIPSASASPYEYVPVNLPQIMMEGRRQIIREPLPAVHIQAGGSINISSGSSLNVGRGMSGVAEGTAWIGISLLAMLLIFGRK